MKYIIILKRTAAYIIDYILLVVCEYILSSLGVTGYIISLFILFIYRYVMTSLYGATVGMKIMKLKLSKYDFKTCFIREVSRVASRFYYIGYAYSLVDTYGRTFHDVVSGVFIGPYESVSKKSDRIVKYISAVLGVLFLIFETSNFVINETGLFGLKKVCTSDEYHQSFDGDNLSSLSNDELYAKTLGRRYTFTADYKGRKYLFRISNKLKYTEVYKLENKGGKFTGSYAYSVSEPFQFICSGKFRGNTRELCGLSPTGAVCVVDEKGMIYGRKAIGVKNALSMKCGDIDGDGYDEIAILGRGGDIDIFKFSGNSLNEIYCSKIGEDIVPQGFYIDGGINVLSKGTKGGTLYTYSYDSGKFTFRKKVYTDIKDSTDIEKVSNGFITSYVDRELMMLKIGNIQNFKVYDNAEGKMLYNLGNRPGRRYSYFVRNIECVQDIDGDDEKEVVVKAVDKNDIMGENYIIEAYKTDDRMLKVNKAVSKILNMFPRI